MKISKMTKKIGVISLTICVLTAAYKVGVYDQANVTYDLYEGQLQAPLTEAQKAEIMRSHLIGRLQEQINQMDGISGSEVTIHEDETVWVALTLIPDAEFTADNENNLLDFIQRSTSFSKEAISLSYR